MAEVKIDVKPGQIYAWRGQEEPRTRFRVEFVGTETVALGTSRQTEGRRTLTNHVTRVSLRKLAAEYDLIEEASR